jgi:hypothetical protein
MMYSYEEQEIIVRPTHGMQLSEGYIRKDNSNGFLGCLLGLVPYAGKTQDEVRIHLELEAKEFYGDDVIVEIVIRHAVAR